MEASVESLIILKGLQSFMQRFKQMYILLNSSLSLSGVCSVLVLKEADNNKIIKYTITVGTIWWQEYGLVLLNM